MTDRFPVPGSLADALDDEWQHLATAPAVVDLANEWQLTDHPVATLDELLAATGYRHRDSVSDTAPPARDTPTRDADGANDVLGDLVRLAPADQLAGRVVLQRILPGLRAAARAWWRGCRPAGVDPGQAFDELVAVAWEVIAGYDVDRRPRNIAGNVIHTTVDRAFVGPARRRAASEHLDDPATLDTAVAVDIGSSSGELIELLADASRHRDADPDAIGLLRDLVVADGSTRAVAEQWGVTPCTIRTRRSQAAAHIRHLVVPDAA